MKFIVRKDRVDIPTGVKVDCKSRVITVTGKRGTVTKNFRHIKVDIAKKSEKVEGKTVDFLELTCYLNTYKQAAIIFTCGSHIRNMITGVTKGYRYKMHLVKKHFPIEVAINDDSNCLEIGRFLGGKELKRIPILEGVKVTKNEKNAEELWFEGCDLNQVSLNCATVQQSCQVKDKDRRMFLDGIYVNEKGNVKKDD